MMLIKSNKQSLDCLALIDEFQFQKFVCASGTCSYPINHIHTYDYEKENRIKYLLI